MTAARQRLLASAMFLLVGTLLSTFVGCSSKTEPSSNPKASRAQCPCCKSLATQATAAAVATTHAELVRPEQAMVLRLHREPWQPLAAVCLTPAFYNRDHATPLIFDDGSEKQDVAIPHQTMAVQDFGNDGRFSSGFGSDRRLYWRS